MTHTSQPNRSTKRQTGPTTNTLTHDTLKDEMSTAKPLSPADIYSDLTKLLNYLHVNLASQSKGTSSFLFSHVQALVYAERVAIYATQDYPRHVEGETRITPLWNVLHRIRRIVSTWRTGEDAGDGQTELAVIKAIVQTALRNDSMSHSANAGQ